jgi:hypothetical protein
MVELPICNRTVVSSSLAVSNYGGVMFWRKKEKEKEDKGDVHIHVHTGWKDIEFEKPHEDMKCLVKNVQYTSAGEFTAFYIKDCEIFLIKRDPWYYAPVLVTHWCNISPHKSYTLT